MINFLKNHKFSVLVWGVFILIIVYLLAFPPLKKCRYPVTHYPLPQFLQNVKIKWGVELVYTKRATPPWCEKIDRLLTFEAYAPYGYGKIISKVPADMEFSVVDYFVTDKREDFDGSQNYYLVLKDKNNVTTMVNYGILSWTMPDSNNSSLGVRHYAGYYLDDKRIGDVDYYLFIDPTKVQNLTMENFPQFLYVNLKVNGSDNPASLKYNAPFVVSWDVNPKSAVCTTSGNKAVINDSSAGFMVNGGAWGDNFEIMPNIIVDGKSINNTMGLMARDKSFGYVPKLKLEMTCNFDKGSASDVIEISVNQ